MKLAPVRKFMYSVPVLSKLMSPANRRYIDFLAAIDDPIAGIKVSIKSPDESATENLTGSKNPILSYSRGPELLWAM